jgi:ligand-binding sensor domain-containing protein
MRTNAPIYRSREVRIAGLFAAALLFLCGMEISAPARGSTPLSGMDHAMWTARDGAPQGILELAQSNDGVLWIGSEGGLFTFDGRTFGVVQAHPGEPDLPAGSVTSIQTTSDGTVWVGYYDGGIVRIANHRTTTFTESDHQQLCCAHFISQAADGAIWAVSGQTTLVRFGRDGMWHIQPNPGGRSGGRMLGIFIDSLNTLWAIQGGQVYRRPLAQSVWYPTEAKADWGFGFAEAADHSVWVSDIMLGAGRSRLQHVDRSGKVIESLTDDNDIGAAILDAPDGSVIAGMWKGGLRRYETVRPAAEPSKTAVSETYTHLDGLSSDATRALLLDED